MLTVSIGQLKSDIAGKMKGTSIREIKDFYGTAAGAANRMLTRIDPDETRRTATLTTPFIDNLNDYALQTDYKGMIDIRPTAGRQDLPGLSHFSGTTPRQFNERLDDNSFSIRWNNMVRTLRAQRLPVGNATTMDALTTSADNGLWTAEDDALTAWDEAINWDQALDWDGGLYTEPLNFVDGNSSLGFNLSGGTGAADILNTTASITDLSAFSFQDISVFFFFIPSGYASRFTSFTLRRGSDASNYVQVTVTTKADGTAFTDGWNLLIFSWNSGTPTGSPDDTLNTYRRFGIAYSAGAFIKGCLVNNWTDSLGSLYEIEYYSEYLFRTSAGIWIQTPTLDSDLLNVGPASYEIFKAEMMVDVVKQTRIGAVQAAELADYRKMLNGDPQTRYVKDPAYHGLYADYLAAYPSTRIPTATKVYDFDC